MFKNQRKVLAFVLVLFTVFTNSYAETEAPKVDVSAWLERAKQNIHKEVLDNGLTILFYKKEYTPEVMIQVVCDVGSKDEKSDEYGYAHLVEHMIFKGTEKLSERDIDEITQRFGATNNAFTSKDMTCYYFRTDNKNWRVFTTVLSDCMQHAKFSEEHLASEMNAVYQEIKMRDDDGVGSAFEALFPVNHPYHHTITGYKENILTADAKDVKAFYKKHYIPSNTTVFVVGELEKEDVIVEIKEKFGNIPSKEPEKTHCKKDFEFVNKEFFEKDTVIYKSTPSSSVAHFWQLPKMGDPELEIMITVFRCYLAKRLGERLYKNKKLTSSISTVTELLQLASVFCVAYFPDENGKNGSNLLEKCKSIVLEEIAAIQRDGIPEKFLKSQKRLEEVYGVAAFNDVLSISNVLREAYMNYHNEYMLFDLLHVQQGVTSEKIKQFVRTYFRENAMCTITYKPLLEKEKDEWVELQKRVDAYDASLLNIKKREKVTTGVSFMDELPAPELLDVVFETPEFVFELSNGLRVVACRKHDTPFVFARCIFKNEEHFKRHILEQQQSQISAYAMVGLTQGSSSYSEQELNEFFTALGADFYRAPAGISFSCLSSDFVSVAQRSFNVLTKPTYPKDLFKKAKQDIKKSIQEQATDLSDVFWEELFLHLFRDDFAIKERSIPNRLQKVSKIKRSDLFSFHKKYVTPENMVLVVVGDFESKEALQYDLEAIMAQTPWNLQGVSVMDVQANFSEIENPEPKTIQKFLPEERTLFGGGRLTVSLDQEDWFTLQFLERYLKKKIYEIRELTGLFYSGNGSVSSGARSEEKGYASIIIDVSLDGVSPVSESIKLLLRDIAENGIPENDFYAARHSIISLWAKAEKTNEDIAITFSNIASENKDWYYYVKRFEKLMAVTKKDVDVVAKKYFNPDDWTFVTVGRVDEKVS